MSTTESRKPATIDAIAKKSLSALGIDLGGTKIRAAIVRQNQMIGEPHQIKTPEGREQILAALYDLIAMFQNEAILGGIGIATAGIVDCTTGEIVGSTGNLPGWSGTKLKEVIESKFLLPVHVENDANAAAYAESRVDALKEKKCVVTVTLGTGIGGGIVIEGKLYHGAAWGAGEIGHIKIAQDNKRMCTCGLFDCWEAFGSGRGLVITAQEMLQNVSADQSPLAEKTESLTTHDIFAAADQDDFIAKKIVQRWHEHIMHGLVCIAHILNPDCYVLTGGLSDFVDFELLKEMVIDRCLPRIADAIDIRKSELAGQAGIIGAAQFALDELLTASQS